MGQGSLGVPGTGIAAPPWGPCPRGCGEGWRVWETSQGKKGPISLPTGPRSGAWDRSRARGLRKGFTPTLGSSTGTRTPRIHDGEKLEDSSEVKLTQLLGPNSSFSTKGSLKGITAFSPREDPGLRFLVGIWRLQPPSVTALRLLSLSSSFSLSFTQPHPFLYLLCV